jgi:hypothetical protein
MNLIRHLYPALPTRLRYVAPYQEANLAVGLELNSGLASLDSLSQKIRASVANERYHLDRA